MVFLSLIVPVYNAEKYLNTCFESIKKQAFRDYEVIIIDDGSTDRSPQICDHYANEDDRVIVYHVSNGGPSKARNIGFKAATGKYIYCIDNDDYISDDDYFNLIFETLSSKPVDVLQTGATYLREDSNTINRRMDYSQVPQMQEKKPSEMLHWLIANKMYETSCWTKVIKKDFLIVNQFFFDTELVVEDLDWNMRFWQKVSSYSILHTASYVHIFRKGSITGGTGEKGYKLCLDQIVTIEKWAKFYEQYDGDNKLREALLSYLSYQFFITMGKASQLDDELRYELFDRLRSIDYITKYAIEKKQKCLCFFYHMFGFCATSKLIKIYYDKMRTSVQ